MAKILEVTEATFTQEVLQADQPVVVDFWAPWCGPCRMMAPVLDKVADKMQGLVKFAKLNTDENMMLSQQHGIQAIPSLLIFHKGQEIHRNIGFMKEQDLEAVLREKLADGKKEGPTSPS